MLTPYTLEIRSVVIAELLEDIRTTFSGQSEETGVEIVIDSEDRLALMADPDRLNQVLINLVANAIRYSTEGDTISIIAKQIDENIEIEVVDTGEGISPDDLTHIFERFWRADKSRTHTDGSGHGLGLSIAQQLVRAHGGEIEAESEIGVGTKFRITIPNTPPSH
jgi:signal transduction histidine kinase